MTSLGLILETGHSEPVYWDNPEGWDWEGGGRGSGWGTHVHPCQYVAKTATILRSNKPPIKINKNNCL